MAADTGWADNLVEVALLPCLDTDLAPAGHKTEKKHKMIGKQQAAHLATRYKTMKRLQLAISSTGNSSSISSSGGSSDPFFDTMAGSSDPFFDTMAGSSLKAWFASSDNKLLLNQLRQAGITCCQEDPTAGSFVPDDQADELALAAAQQTGVSAGLPAGAGQQQPLQGLSICITGIIANPQFANRKEVEDYITKLGGTFKNSLTKSISWLVVGSGATPGDRAPPQGKRTKAAAWGIKVLSEEEFFAEVEKLSQQ